MQPLVQFPVDTDMEAVMQLMKAVPISSSNKTGSSLTASTGADSEEVEKFAIYPLSDQKHTEK